MLQKIKKSYFLDLNTYHVKVQCSTNFILVLGSVDLNTYHVKVQFRKIKIRKDDVKI